MAVQKFDKLNNFKSMPFDEYFKPMQLSPSQLKARMTIARNLETALQTIFLMASIYGEVGLESVATDLQANLKEEYINAILDFVEVDTAMVVYIESTVKQLIDTTVKNYAPTTQNSGANSEDNAEDSNYYVSDDRARLIAENEANKVMNNQEFKDAKANGYTHKTWVTMQDLKVRDSHFLVDGETIPIDEPFVVGTSLMNYPTDTSLGASGEEVVNCRCQISYS